MNTGFAFLLPTYMAIFAVVFLIVGRWHKRGASWWALAFACTSIGFLMPVLPEVLQNNPYVALFADGCFTLAFLAFGQGLLGYIGKPRAFLRTRLAIGVTTVAICAVADCVVRDMPLEFVTSDLSCGLLLVPVLIAMRRRLAVAINRLLFAVTVLVVIENAGRGVVVSALLASGHPGYLRVIYGFEMQTGAAILGMIWGLTALAAILLDVLAGYAREAVTDPLSGLLNRRGFERALADVPAHGCMIIGDIDHFKRVNDHFGHLAGDRVIAALASMIRAALPPGGIAARTGGEEFAIFLPGAPLVEASRVATIIRLQFAEADWREIGITGHLTASFGVAATRGGDAGRRRIVAGCHGARRSWAVRGQENRAQPHRLACRK